MSANIVGFSDQLSLLFFSVIQLRELFGKGSAGILVEVDPFDNFDIDTPLLISLNLLDIGIGIPGLGLF